MSDLIAVAYPDASTAKEVAEHLAGLTKERTLELEDLVVVDRDDKGKIRLHQTFSPAKAGAAGGALWGGAIGLLFLSPLLGMAIGAATGAAVGAGTDYGVDDAFMKGLGERLDDGQAAVVVLVRHVTVDKVLPRISTYGGEVIHSSLSADAEDRLKAALDTDPVSA